MNRLDYNYVPEGQQPHDTTSFRIQASSISQFFDYTNQWYRTKLLGEDGFLGNNSSVIGTCLHFLSEQYTNSQITAEDKQEVYAYINEQAELQPDVIDVAFIREQLTPMWKELKSHLDNKPLSLAEPFLELQMLPGITVGGSIDGLRCLDGTKHQSLDTMSGKQVEIVDWKTTSALNAPTTISKAYEFQLLTYAYVLKQKYNINVVSMNITYITQNQVGRISETTGKPMKDYPTTVSEVIKPVTSESLEFIESVIKLVAHSVHRFVTVASDRFLLSQDYRLINHTDPLPFTSIGKEQEIDI